MTTTLDPVLSGVREITRNSLRCIGRFETLDGAVDYPISWEEAARDAEWAARALSALGVARGDFVIVVSTGHEAPWYGPILDALYARGATVFPLEPAPYEQGRAEMFLRRFPIAHLIGLDLELCAALDAGMGIKQLFSAVRTIIARPEAWKRLQGFSGSKGMILPLGPAIGMPCREAPVVHIDSEEWDWDQVSDIVSLGPRRSRVGLTVRTGVANAGSIFTDHRCDCGLGSLVYRPDCR